MVTLDSIRAARERIRSRIYESPCAYSEALSQLTGNQLWLKLENLQMTGSFKERGALNRILTLAGKEEAARGVIAASAGNHAQAVSFHATQHGIRAQICMPVTAPLNKVTQTRAYGAEVVLVGETYDDAYQEACRRQQQYGFTFLHAFNDEDVIAGQGTIGLEVLEQVPQLQALIAPIGGGGLLGGIACAIKELRPEVRVIGVQTERVPSMVEALRAHHPVTVPAAATIAEGALPCGAQESLTAAADWSWLCRRDDLTVSEDEIANAITCCCWSARRPWRKARETARHGYAVAAADKTSLSGKNVVSVVCGRQPRTSPCFRASHRAAVW